MLMAENPSTGPMPLADDTHLEQQAADLRLRLEERDDELAAARAAGRELMTRLNHSAATR